ncbi:hypothetical protein CLU79DRAFT_846465 [Phycomyces nitens]|nr:hypothetical protein CLU79DRAFT_846465 [Phycomyces nitens]
MIQNDSTNVEKESKRRRKNTTKRPYRKAFKIASVEGSNQEIIKKRPATHKRTTKKVKDGSYLDRQNKPTKSRNVQKKRYITRSLTKVNGDSILLGPIKNPDRISAADFLVYTDILSKISNESLVPENTTEDNEQLDGTPDVDSNQSSSEDEFFDAVSEISDIKDEPNTYLGSSRMYIQPPTIQKVFGVERATQTEPIPDKKQRECLGIDVLTYRLTDEKDLAEEFLSDDSLSEDSLSEECFSEGLSE